MTVKVQCPKCGKTYSIPDHQPGLWCPCGLESNPSRPTWIDAKKDRVQEGL